MNTDRPVIKSERAVCRLRWLRAEKIPDAAPYRALLKEEQEAYREEFVHCMEETEDFL